MILVAVHLCSKRKLAAFCSADSRSFRLLSVASLIAVCLECLSCGSYGTSSTPPPISVSLAPPSASVAVNQTKPFTANVSYDSQNKGVTWSLNCTGGGCGSLSPSPTPNPVTSAAPASVPAAAVTLTATSNADSTKTASATITVTSTPPPISVSVSPTSAGVQVNQTSNFTATVQNDPMNRGVTWSLSCTGSCGSLSPSPTANPVTFTAPATVPTSAVTLTATSVADTTKSASSLITILPSTGTSTPTYANNGVSCSNTQGTARSSYVCPLPNVTGAGNAVVVFAQWNNTVTTTVTDDKGNTYTQAACVTGSQAVCAYLALNVHAGARVITITPSGSTNYISAAGY